MFDQKFWINSTYLQTMNIIRRLVILDVHNFRSGSTFGKLVKSVGSNLGVEQT